MATLQGTVAASGEGFDGNANLTPELAEYTVDFWPIHEFIGGAAASSAFIDNTPIAQVVLATLAGAFAPAYRPDYYFRVHIRPRALNLGAVATSQEIEIEVWSAHFVSNTLNAINEDGTEGLALVGPAAPPTVFLPLDSRVYTLSADPVGPAVVDALWTFLFDLDTATLEVSGDRVAPFPFPPDWNEPVLERLAWLTDVLVAHNGKEQRQRVRANPRARFEFRIMHGGDFERVSLENLIEGWQSRIFGLPLWHQVSVAPAAIPAGSLGLTVATDGAQYVAGGLVGIFRGIEAELVEIASVGAGSLTLADETVQTWPAGARIAPVRLARMVNSQSITYLSDAIAAANVAFELIGEEAIAAASEAADYLGEPVYLDRNDWTEEPDEEHARIWERIDQETGAWTVDDRAGVALPARSHALLFDGRAAVESHRAFLAARAGRLAPIWLPSHQNDLKLVALVGSADTSLSVENRDHARWVPSQLGRRDIMIWLHDGTRFYRRILSAVESSETVEVVTIDAALGQVVQVADVRMISYMRLVRLAADAAEIAHETDAIARARLRFRAIRDDA